MRLFCGIRKGIVSFSLTRCERLASEHVDIYTVDITSTLEVDSKPNVSPVAFLAHDLGCVSFNLSNFRGHYWQLLSTTQLRSQGITPGQLSDSTQLPSTGKYSNTSLAFN